ncbi:MAG: hypothetical protein A3B10_00565 [Candidatus Doudnabacteria bacterium RIFCSPLOWO2_01_FULL_44_21]|uniref:Beta-glucosidase n=1 Tax=Candidatus Doudnabacteria bacterium RIFCSPLOWO2_01_FULL_44_21 TaxID=1817841 RepID=A0A1F5PXG5_9BACT|nr:MAG: hypothetical protein A3B95_01170 [Candidatus Doudnabacteria bacterium RIFCSPHIGHO2_02_FULL_43_13b]OGE94631.1 MAG: hypothetical protein A3B10_00565 [Candidatus Doudnabacteria bacterium RIFCSPLOWO2_01_FULL_44_21]
MEPSQHPETNLQFPKGFLIGAAASAHQVEGNNANSDWWHFEQMGKLPKSGLACDHYNRFDDDFGIAQQIGLNAMRISIEWARIEPEEGKWSAAAIEHYKKVLRSMKDHGLTRMVTLWHWTLPKWLADKGGFETNEGVEAFARYAWFVAQNLGKEVDFWVTLNEPEIYTLLGYKQAIHPPFIRSNYLTYRVMRNLIWAHRAAFKAIKTVLGDVPVGIAKNSACYQPFRKNNFLDSFIIFVFRYLDFYLLNRIHKQLDFIGLNYYFLRKIKFDWRHLYLEMKPNDPLNFSDMGWYLFPEGIYRVLLNLKKFHKPIYVTENGLADARDDRRPKFLQDTLFWINRAIEKKVDVRGYFYWSLTDNYEWHDGFGPKFGLVAIDYQNLKRTVRPSAKIFKQIFSV